MNKEISNEIKKNLSLEQILELLTFLGADCHISGDKIISQTICHGGNAHKLYYYSNSTLFRCFTECNDTFDIYELIIKVKEQAGIEWSLPQAINYVVSFFHINIDTESNFFIAEEIEDWKILKQYEKNASLIIENKKIEFEIQDKNILKFLPTPIILPWIREGISREVMDHCGICYNPSSQGIVIPHYDKDNNLIGIRERTLIKENEANGKYRPAILNNKMYNHPLGFTTYNLNNSKNQIKVFKTVIVFEGEKSCLLYQSLFGIENDISVAVCGSNITIHQIKELINQGAEEVVIAFDKQFKALGDEECFAWTKKLTLINNKYGALIKISFMFDKTNKLDYKDSPIDKGKEIFLQLFQERIKL